MIENIITVIINHEKKIQNKKIFTPNIAEKLKYILIIQIHRDYIDKKINAKFYHDYIIQINVPKSIQSYS